jgi:hypothetical protein
MGMNLILLVLYDDSMLAEATDNLGHGDHCLLGLYDDSSVAETPDNLMYDFCLLVL